MTAWISKAPQNRSFAEKLLKMDWVEIVSSSIGSGSTPTQWLKSTRRMLASSSGSDTLREKLLSIIALLHLWMCVKSSILPTVCLNGCGLITQAECQRKLLARGSQPEVPKVGESVQKREWRRLVVLRLSANK